MKQILVDLGKLRNRFTGLGEVSWQFGSTLAIQKSMEFEFSYLLPRKYNEQFGKDVQYQFTDFSKRYFPGFFKAPDLWHAIHQDSSYMPPNGTPYLLTIHDLNFLLEKSHPKAEGRLKKLQKKVSRATAVAFISKYAQKDACSHLKINVPMRVIYNGVSLAGCQADATKPGFLKQSMKNFFFCIGVVKEKKNFHVLLDMMEKISDRILVIAGDISDPYAQKMKRDIELKKLTNRVIMPGIVTQNEKRWLYENCEAFFFPSKIEGFGIPVIEAMSYGKPVFLSRFTSLPEIGGTEGFYWEDFNADHMAALYHEKKDIMNSRSLIEARKKRAEFFSWEKNVNEYLDYYRCIFREIIKK